MRRPKLLVAPLLLASVTPLFAGKYAIDPVHSTVGFSVRHMVGRVHGSFDKFAGTIEFNGKDVKGLKTEAAIDVNSINTRNEKRDTHLKSAEFFDAAKYPKIEFHSTGVTPMGKTRAKVKGKLTMHGVTKPITLDVVFNGQVKDPWGNQRAGFSGKAILNRKDFGISWNKVLDAGGAMIGEQVTINLEIEAVLQAEHSDH